MPCFPVVLVPCPILYPVGVYIELAPGHTLDNTKMATPLSFAQRQNTHRDGKVHWPVRLEKVMIPTLMDNSIQHSLHGGFVYVSNGSAYINPNAYLNKRRKGGDALIQNANKRAESVNDQFTLNYQTIGALNLATTAEDYIITTQDGFVDETTASDWEEFYNATMMKSKDDNKCQSVPCEMNDASKDDITARYGSDARKLDAAEDKVDVLTYIQMPQYPYTNLNVYFSTGGKSLETSKGASTRAFEDHLKARSVEMAQTIGGTKMPEDKAKRGLDASLFLTREGEQSRANERGWRLLLFEWAPLVNDKFWPTVNTPDGKNSFVESRLNNLRYYVGVAMLLDSQNLQQYYAWAPDNVADFKQQFIEFHASVISNNLPAMERYRMKTIDPLSKFTSDDAAVVKAMINDVDPNSPLGGASEIFKPGSYSPNAEQISSILSASSMPFVTTKQGDLMLDLDRLSLQKYENFMRSLPKTPPSTPDVQGAKSSSIWAYNVVVGDLETLNKKPTRVFKDSSKAETVRQRFQIRTSTDLEGGTRIIHPVVHRAFLTLKQEIDSLGGLVAVKATQFNRNRVQALFQTLFYPDNNLYIQHEIGDKLNKALSMDWNALAGQKARQRRVNVYRQIAQKLLDGTAFSHSLGRYECMYVFYKDIVSRLITVSTMGGDLQTAQNLRQVAYAICIAHPQIGVKVETFRPVIANMQNNTRTLRDAAVRRLGTCAEYIQPTGNGCFDFTIKPELTDEEATRKHNDATDNNKDRLDALMDKADTFPGYKRIVRNPYGVEALPVIDTGNLMNKFLTYRQNAIKENTGQEVMRIVGSGITPPNLWHTFEYWAMVLLTRDYYDRHTFGLVSPGSKDIVAQQYGALALVDQNKLEPILRKKAEDQASNLVKQQRKTPMDILTESQIETQRQMIKSGGVPEYEIYADQNARERAKMLGVKR